MDGWTLDNGEADADAERKHADAAGWLRCFCLHVSAVVLLWTRPLVPPATTSNHTFHPQPTIEATFACSQLCTLGACDQLAPSRSMVTLLGSSPVGMEFAASQRTLEQGQLSVADSMVGLSAAMMPAVCCACSPCSPTFHCHAGLQTGTALVAGWASLSCEWRGHDRRMADSAGDIAGTHFRHTPMQPCSRSLVPMRHRRDSTVVARVHPA